MYDKPSGATFSRSARCVDALPGSAREWWVGLFQLRRASDSPSALPHSPHVPQMLSVWPCGAGVASVVAGAAAPPLKPSHSARRRV